MSDTKGTTLVPAEPWVDSVTLGDGDESVTFRKSGKDDNGDRHSVAKSKVKGFQEDAAKVGVTLVDKSEVAEAEGDEATIEEQN